MIKLKATDLLIVNGEVMENHIDIILHHSAKSILAYQHHTGKKFFDDFKKAINSINIDKLMEMSKNNNGENTENNEQSISIALDLMTNNVVNEFLLDAIPAMYAKIENGKFVQNDITYQEAIEAEWLTSLISLDTIMTLVNEVNKGQMNSAQNGNNTGKKTQ